MEDIALSIVNKLGKSMTSGLDRIYDMAMEYSDVIATSAQLICGLLAFLYIGSKLWKSWAQGEPIDFYAMLRPFAVGLLILFFGGFTFCLDSLVAPVSEVTAYVRDSAADKVASKQNRYDELQRIFRDKRAAYERSKQEQQEQLSVWRSIKRSLENIESGLSTALSNLGSAVTGFLMELGSMLVGIFSTATVYFYRIYVITARIVLVLIGPFALALSILPGFESNLKSWVAQYINVSLYIPICNIIGFVQSLIVSECLYTPSIGTLEEISMVEMTESVISDVANFSIMNNVASILLGIVAIMLYAHVPTFANWILKGDGSGGLAAAFSVGTGLLATQINKLIPTPGGSSAGASGAMEGGQGHV